MKNRDLYHGDGNSTVASTIPTKIKNRVGLTNPYLKDAGKLLPTKKVIQKGWSK
jgi:hypothetical protein